MMFVVTNRFRHSIFFYCSFLFFSLISLYFYLFFAFTPFSLFFLTLALIREVIFSSKFLFASWHYYFQVLTLLLGFNFGRFQCHLLIFVITGFNSYFWLMMYFTYLYNCLFQQIYLVGNTFIGYSTLQQLFFDYFLEKLFFLRNVLNLFISCCQKCVSG